MSSAAKDPVNSGAPLELQSAASPHMNVVALTIKAFEVATAAATNAADSVSSPTLAQAVFDCEKELDTLDRQMDECFATVLTQSSPQQVRELLACMKCMIDLERIGDLISSFVSRCRIVAARLDMQDISDLINMNSHLESMLNEVSHAFRTRNLSRAIGVLRSDREIDRIRNLIFLRHLQDQASCAGPDSIHVLLMAQALERAGDHAKNIAEEICHFVSGRTIRHVPAGHEGSIEQLYLAWLLDQYKGTH
jgi:phosphate transport system protein